MKKNVCIKCNEPETNMNNKTGINSYLGDNFELWFCNDCAINRDNFIRESRDDIVLKLIQNEYNKIEEIKWNYRPILPNHNDLVIIVHRPLNVYVCVFKILNDENFGKMNLFVPIEDMGFFGNEYLNDSIDWYRDRFSYNEVYVDAWVYFPKL